MRKKVKKVIKGLEKASKTHAKQAKILKSGLKVFKARGGRDMGAGSSGMGAGKSGSNMGGSGAVDTGDLGSEAANVAANISATTHRGGGGNGADKSTNLWSITRSFDGSRVFASKTRSFSYVSTKSKHGTTTANR